MQSHIASSSVIVSHLDFFPTWHYYPTSHYQNIMSPPPPPHHHHHRPKCTGVHVQNKQKTRSVRSQSKSQPGENCICRENITSAEGRLSYKSRKIQITATMTLADPLSIIIRVAHPALLPLGLAWLHASPCLSFICLTYVYNTRTHIAIA